MVTWNKQRRNNKFKKEIEHLKVRNDVIFNGKNQTLLDKIEALEMSIK